MLNIFQQINLNNISFCLYLGTEWGWGSGPGLFIICREVKSTEILGIWVKYKLKNFLHWNVENNKKCKVFHLDYSDNFNYEMYRTKKKIWVWLSAVFESVQAGLKIRNKPNIV